MLNGPRVTLRAVEPAEHETLARFKNDLEFELAGGGRPPRPFTLADYEEFWTRFIASSDGVTFAIEADGKLIGDCGLFNVNRVNASAELGIGIGDHAYWSKGYGREAIGLLVDYGFELQNLRRIWLEVIAGNERGIRCYRSCGFVEEGRLREHQWSNGKFQDMVYMGLLRSEHRSENPGRPGAGSGYGSTT